MTDGPRIWVRKQRWWWSAINPDESLGWTEINTTLRALTRERVIEKWRKRLAPEPPSWEEVVLDD